MKNWFRRSGLKAPLSLTIVLSVGLASCSRPVGDFGRAESTVSHDQIAPVVGKAFALHRKEPVSLFSRTDEEIRLENVVWTIVRPLHSKDWISGSLIEGRRTRIFPEINRRLNFRAYLFWLQTEKFVSSEARWNRIISDIRADQGAITPFYDQARVVYTIDQQRLVFLNENQEIDPHYHHNTRARLLENEKLAHLALDSFQLRYKAYDHAIKHLTLELPSPRALFARDELVRYGELIERGGQRGIPFLEDHKPLSSRIAKEHHNRKDDDDAHLLK